jgi:hypothetical protein
VGSNPAAPIPTTPFKSQEIKYLNELCASSFLAALRSNAFYSVPTCLGAFGTNSESKFLAGSTLEQLDMEVQRGPDSVHKTRYLC